MLNMFKTFTTNGCQFYIFKLIFIYMVATFKFHIYYDSKQIFEKLHTQCQKVVFNNSVLYKFSVGRNYFSF